MALEPGGYADKLGNRYEGLWITRQLLLVLNEDLISVAVESVGDSEDGSDLCIIKRGGIKQAQQCKVRNVNKGSWSVTDLANRGVLSQMKVHLDVDPSNEFALVTAIPSPVLHDICTSARNSSGNAETFFAKQIEAVSEARRKAFRQFCRCLELDPEQESGRLTAYLYLKRLFIENWTDTTATRGDLNGLAEMLVAGDANTIVALLSDFAADNLRRDITASDLWKLLSSEGLYPRRLASDTRIVPRVLELREQFSDSIKNDLIDDRLISRPEAARINDALREHSLIIVHGSPGSGKSGVLYELTQVLNAADVEYLPIRLDRKVPVGTPSQYGAELGLPESPVLCLDSIAKDQRSVLILDQLDALRWTSRHSKAAIDVCRSLVREAKYFQRLGKKINVVLACRTYDLKNDPEIKRWIRDEEADGQKVVEIALTELTSENVREIVLQCGFEAEKLSARQLSILQSPQHLSMWARMVRKSGVFEFQNRIQIMRQYWASREQELIQLGHSTTEVATAVSSLVDYLEMQGHISAPKSIVDNTILDSLFAVGLLQDDGSRVVFSHQSYLDYLIARRVVRQLHLQGNDICKWLGASSIQSLFRREQLRQALFLLVEESPDLFLRNLQMLLGSNSVRFHLKHLCLEVLGELEAPTESLQLFLLELTNDPRWAEHIFGTVYLGHLHYLRWLFKGGHISKWLEKEETRNYALWMLRAAPKELADEVTTIVRPYASLGGDWTNRVLGCLSWLVEDDSEEMFELRLELAREGVYGGYISWQKLPAHRVWRLFDAILSSLSFSDLPKDYFGTGRSKFESWSTEDLDHLVASVRDNAEAAWQALVEHVQRLVPNDAVDLEQVLELWLDNDRYCERHGMESIPHAITNMCIAAGKTLAESGGDHFWRSTVALRENESRVIRFILIEAYSALSTDCADRVVEWLLSDESLWEVGTDAIEPRWMPMARLLQANSPHCNDTLFRNLEERITRHSSPDQLDDAKYWLPCWRQGYYGDFWGRAQYFLLPSLCDTRRSSDTIDLIGVLNRKFASYPEHRFVHRTEPRVGFVGATLSSDLKRISDKSWLAIIQSKKVPVHRGRWTRYSNEGCQETSIRQFSMQLAHIAKRFPERFAELALSFPPDVAPMYKAAILEGLLLTEPKDVPDIEKADWHAASVESIERVLAAFGTDNNSEFARKYCWLICERAEENWSATSLNKLKSYAIDHSDPKDDLLVMWPSADGPSSVNATVHSLEDNAINCVRGIAAIAIGQLLWANPALLGAFTSTISKIVKDRHPAVATAAVRMCIPILNLDADFALNSFTEIVSSDVRPAASRRAVYFFNSGIPARPNDFQPIVLRMLRAEKEDVAQRGASEVAARWLFHGYFENEIQQCLGGSTAQKVGLAQVAVQFIEKPEYFEKCESIIDKLSNDADKEVRREVSRVARCITILDSVKGLELIDRYIRSQSFIDDPDGFLYTLREYTGDLIPFAPVLMSVCDQIIGPLRDESRDPQSGLMHDVSQFVPLLLRLYEQADDARNVEIVNRCLDALDELFRMRVGMTQDIAKLVG